MLSPKDNELICRVSKGTPMGEWLRRFWLPTLLSEELPENDGEPKEVRILGEDLVAFRDTEGKVGLITTLCPHRQAPLVLGRNEESGLRCIYHGWKFDVNGYCTDMPSEPADSQFKDKVRASSYPVREWGGIIWSYMGPRELMPELPAVEFARVPENQRYMTKYKHNSNWVQGIEGDADSSHVGFLHKDLTAPGDLATMPLQQRYTTLDQAPKWLVQPTNYGMLLAARRNAEEDTYYWRINQWIQPFYTFIAGNLDQSRGHCHGWVPIDDEWTWTWDIVWSPKEPLNEQEIHSMTGGPRPHIATLDPLTYELRGNKKNKYFWTKEMQRTKNFSGLLGTREQDTAVTTAMGAIVDRTKEHLGTSDMAIIAMRRLLIKAAKDMQDGIEPYAASHPDALKVRGWSAVLPRRDDFMNDPEVSRLSQSVVP